MISMGIVVSEPFDGTTPPEGRRTALPDPSEYPSIKWMCSCEASSVAVLITAGAPTVRLAVMCKRCGSALKPQDDSGMVDVKGPKDLSLSAQQKVDEALADLGHAQRMADEGRYDQARLYADRARAALHYAGTRMSAALGMGLDHLRHTTTENGQQR